VPTIFLPEPSAQEPRQIPKKVTETATIPQSQAVPGTAASTPDEKQKLLNPPQVKEEPKTFEDEQQAIKTEGSGLFDTKGFPLGDYARLIIDRIKGNWSIPSNLRNSQGRSTLVFFIEKDGQVWDLRIVGSSGSSSLDSAAQQAIWISRPFPPLPTGFPGKQVGAKFVFSYNERQ
jgi:TonB family protein